MAEDKLLRNARSAELTAFELSGVVVGLVVVGVFFGTVRVVRVKFTLGAGLITLGFSTGILSTGVKSGLMVSLGGLTGSIFSGVGAGAGGVISGFIGVGAGAGHGISLGPAGLYAGGQFDAFAHRSMDRSHGPFVCSSDGE